VDRASIRGTIMFSLVLAAVHLLSLALGVALLVLRGKSLQQAKSEQDLGRVFLWDNLYGLLALFWIGSGLLRAFGGFEKGTEYYLSNHVFWTKLVFVVLLLGLEAPILAALIRFRVRKAKGQTIELGGVPRLVRLHWLELGTIFPVVLAATLMARGVGTVSKAADSSGKPAVVAANAGDAKRGEAVYRSACISCHQADGRGAEGRLAADFTTDRARLAKSDDALVASILNGVPGTAMVPFAGRLSESDARDVVAYLRATFEKR
jgi:putative membrane protein